MSPVDVKIQDGDLYYVDLLGGKIHRVRYFSGNQPPTAVASANPSAGPAPLLVNLDGSASTDPEGNPLTYSWDLNGDGIFGDSTSAQTTYTFSPSGAFTVSLRVTDSEGLSDVTSISVADGRHGLSRAADRLTLRVASVEGRRRHRL